MARYKKRHKPKRKKIRFQGKVFASESEVNFAKECNNKGIPWVYEPESFQWAPKLRSYTPDFKIKRNDGSYFYVEYKGFLWQEDQQKMKAIKKQHPDKDIRFVFADSRKPVHGAKTRKNGTKRSHAEWAEANGYKWAESFIPHTWLEEKGK